MCWVTLQYCWEVLQAVGVLAGSTGRLLPARGSSEVRLDASFVCFPQRGRVYSLLAILTWRRSWCWCPLSPLYCGRLVCVSGERQSSQLSVTVQGRFRFLIRMGAKNYWEPWKQVFLENMCIRSPDRSPWCFTAVVTCLHAQESVLGELVENTSCAEFSQIHFTSAKLFGFIYQVLILGQNAAIGAVLYLF